MARADLKQAYRNSDYSHLFHGLTVPSDFANSGSRIYVEGKGTKIKDIDGKEYIDFTSGGLVSMVGYGNQELAAVAMVQMSKMHHVPDFAGRASLPDIDLAKKMSEIAPPGLTRFMFVNSGSDANESAFKLVRCYWRELGKNKYKIMFLDRAYHGATFGAQSASGPNVYTTKAIEPLVPGFIRIVSPYCYRCPLNKTYPQCDVACADAIEEAIKKEGADTVGAFIAEPAQSVAGDIIPVKEYWPKVMDILKRHHVLLHIDEVITGFGRTGKLWGCNHWDIRPDIMVFSKGLASGYMPIAGMGVTEEVYKGLTKGDKPFPHGFTYGGHAVACAVALKNIEIILRDKLVENAATIGKYIQTRLEAIKEQSPFVGDVRGWGLHYVMELVKDKTTKEPLNVAYGISDRLYNKGFVMGRLAPFTVGLAPPLIITKAEIDSVLEELEKEIKNIKP